ncbi:UbiA family prenyltransferase [Phytohabitans houttuyneae]|uniref:UbiA family prenyltransferase n=1 Tax=Phytohabitans houttuyneae TaxID=1076126 RepID=UPI001566E81D|nr:UbiA family prenyltransferase [Phytohabitans houttuyneae]
MTTAVRPPASTATRALALLRLTRPWFWPLGWAGAYFGWVLAAAEWVPPLRDQPAAVAAVVVLGPLVWGAVLAMNDLYDLPNDRRSPRKSTAPLVTGVLTVTDLKRAYWWCSIAAIAISVAAGPWFVAGTVIVLVLGWLYSTPPVRLKARPGADVAVNTLVVGVFAPLGGWSLHRSVLDYPPILVLLGLLLGAALYVPTTVMDRDADLAAGDTTFAVRWTPRACYRLGLALWTAANVIWLACCHLDVLVTRDSWTLQTVAAPALVAVYAVATRKPSIPRMAVVSFAFAVPGTDFLLAVAG